jgi:uncharacterized protein (TIGR00730 family)
MLKSVCVYCASSDKAPAIYQQAATDLGAALARAGLTVVYGGGGAGLMGRLASGALAEGGKVIGVIPQFMDELEWGHGGLSERHVVDDMHVRKRRMLELSDAVVALPGGCGTFEELFEALTWKRLGLWVNPIVLVNVNGFYDPCLTLMQRAIEERFMDPRHRDMWSVVNDPSSVVKALHAAPGWSEQARAFAVMKDNG